LRAERFGHMIVRGGWPEELPGKPLYIFWLGKPITDVEENETSLWTPRQSESGAFLLYLTGGLADQARLYLKNGEVGPDHNPIEVRRAHCSANEDARRSYSPFFAAPSY